MARIKHIGMFTTDVEKTAAFYKEVFGLKQVGRANTGVFLSDGYINVSILDYNYWRDRPGHGHGKEGVTRKVGIDHFGFQVEDVDATTAKLEQHGGKRLMDRVNLAPTDPSTPQFYYEIRCVAPDNQVIDVSSVGWIGTD